MHTPLMDIPEDLRARAARIRLVAFDVDGTLTDGRLWLDAEGRDSKAFSARDGLGLRMLEDNGIAVAWITARDSASARVRAHDLRISHVFTGVHDKLACLRELCAGLGLGHDEVAYMGDDLNDLCLFGDVGLAACPADARRRKAISSAIRIWPTRWRKSPVADATRFTRDPSPAPSPPS